MGSGDVKYRTALIDGGSTIDIDQVNKEKLAGLDYKHDFTCPCCGKEMRAALGDHNAHHFRHIGTECTPNYYLHSTAEQVFYEEYKKCLDERRPFVITVYSEVQCVDSCSRYNRYDCPKRYIKKTINLTEVYTKISPETKVMIDGRFRRPDLLLESETGKQLWVEIWVTHKTDEDKRKDRDILEIKIESEEDIERIRSHELIQKDHSDKNVRLYRKEVCESPESNPIQFNDDKPSQKEIVHFPEPKPVLKSEQVIGSSILQVPIDHQTVSFNVNDLKDIGISRTPEYHNSAKPEWVDLGLPSGTLWSKELMGCMSFDKAQTCFPNMIPSPGQFEELVNSCICKKNFPGSFIGPNGSRLEIYEGDFWTNKELSDNQAVVFHREFLSGYLKPSKNSTRMSGNGFAKTEKNNVLCIRLVKKE